MSLDLVAMIAAAKPSWSARGLCTRAGKRVAWFSAGEDDQVEFAGRMVSGRQAQILATQKFCIDCDVQWDCALWAVTNEEPQGVWGMTVRDLLWLQRGAWGELLIESARDEGVPVQIAVRRARACVREVEAA